MNGVLLPIFIYVLNFHACCSLTADFVVHGNIHNIQSLTIILHGVDSENKDSGNNLLLPHRVSINSTDAKSERNKQTHDISLPDHLTDNMKMNISKFLLVSQHSSSVSHNLTNKGEILKELTTKQSGTDYDGESEEDDDDDYHRDQHSSTPILEESGDLKSKLTEFTLNSEEEKLLKEGVKLNYIFNETLDVSDNPEKLISSPGCPPSGEIIFAKEHPWNRNAWLYYGNPPRCFLTGIQGPCPRGMAFGPLPNSMYGICKCRCFTEFTDAFSDLFEEDQVIDPYLDQKQTFCVDLEKQSHFGFYTNSTCYEFGKRGPCRVNELFAYDPYQHIGTCEFRPCPASKVSYNGSCVEYRSSCENTPSRNVYVRDTETMNKFVISKTKRNPVPECVPYSEALGSVSSTSGNLVVSANLCSDFNQMYSSILERCIPYVRLQGTGHFG